jgi:hypothetical protein
MNAARERSLHSKLLCTFSAEVTREVTRFRRRALAEPAAAHAGAAAQEW